MRHPTAQLRSDYAAANLAPGAALAVAAHLEHCPVCAAGVEAMSADGGAGPPEPSPRTFAAAAGDPQLPRALATMRPEVWRWLRPGVKVAALKGASGLGEAVYLLKAAAGATLPFRRNRAVEQFLVLAGGFRDGGETYASGDFAELAGRGLERPIAEPPGCVCLVVTDATWPAFGIGRLLHHFARRAARD